MTSVILHGRLGREFGEHHKFLVRKPIDAIRALIANKKGFYKAFKTWGKEGKLYQIICDDKIIENENELNNLKKINEIHICPVIIGAGGDGGVVQTVVGVILIVVGLAISPYAPGVGAVLVDIGIAMVVGGVMAMLFPPPTPTFESNIQSKSFLFSSTENSTVQGVPVPIGYGRMRVGSKVISTSLQPRRFKGSGSVSSGNSVPKREYKAEDLQKMREQIQNAATSERIYQLGINLGLSARKAWDDFIFNQKLIENQGSLFLTDNLG